MEMIQLESPPGNLLCTVCNSATGTYRCKDCIYHNFYCTSCCLSIHSTTPFHRIQRFNGEYFERYDLDQLGITINLHQHTGECRRESGEHTGGSSLPDDFPSDPFDDDESEWEDDDSPQSHPNDPLPQGGPGFRRIIIISSTGIYRRTVRWCVCPNALPKDIQLLRCKLFPATFKNPSSAFTFEVLDHFRLDALECNTAALNFVSKLVRITNEVFPSTVPVCPQ